LSRFASGTYLIYRISFGLSTTFLNYFGICFLLPENCSQCWV
jgi:hypothetical protein